MSARVSPRDLTPGDQFAATVPRYRGKPRRVVYTVTGFSEFRGRQYLNVSSVAQGDGSMLLDAMPDEIEVIR